jgi:membrane protease YdiL (CAAX protease family)
MAHAHSMFSGEVRGVRGTVVFGVGFLVIWAAMYGIGVLQDGGVRLGVLGLIVTFAAAAVWEVAVMGTPPRQVAAALGFARPVARGMVAAAVVAALVIAYYVLYSALVAPLRLKAGWPWLVIGLFAYHGLAEELAWRGYAFRRLRESRSFGTAVLWTMPLIAITHLPILVTSGPLIGAVAMLVAAVTCLPLAQLWERGGRTIWGAALVHAAIDIFKLVDPPTGDAGIQFSLGLSLVSIVVPFLVFLPLFRERADH